MTQSPNETNQLVAQTLLEEIVKEKRSKRRWGIFFKILILLWLLLVVISMFRSNNLNMMDTSKPHTALIDIQGTISESHPANSDHIASSLHRAFEASGSKAIILRINSPGGTPVTADYIYNEIKRLRSKYPKKKVYAVCVDACASGAYYIAAAADEIYANPASFVGSIAVIFNGFGFVNSLDKLGIERRMFASGENKGFMDPFSPVVDEQVQTLKHMLANLHSQFVNDVKAGRGERLSNDASLFTGLYWTGVRAKELGLIDGFGSTGQVARDVIEVENIINYTYRPSYFEQLAKHFGMAVGNHSQIAPLLMINEWLKQHLRFD